LGELFQFSRGDNKGHAVKAFLKFVFARVDLIINQIVAIVLLIIAIFIHFRHDR